MRSLHEKTDADILFKRIKNVALIQPYRSQRFMDFVRAKNPGSTFHHCFGSLGSLKSTDLLGVAAPLDEHLEGEENRDWIIQQMPKAIKNLLEYVELLESELKGRKHAR